jgi:ketosteroid isomerase-like protein
VRERWRQFFEAEGPSLTWEPFDAAAASSGDLGYTRGQWKLEQGRPDGGTVTAKYVTIWRREPDGRWRAVVDIGSLDQEPPAADTSAASPDS